MNILLYWYGSGLILSVPFYFLFQFTDNLFNYPKNPYKITVVALMVWPFASICGLFILLWCLICLKFIAEEMPTPNWFSKSVITFGKKRTTK